MASMAAGDGDNAPPRAVTDVTNDVFSVIAAWLPTRDSYRLSPPPLPLPDGGPDALVIQPRRRVGYTHLTLVATDPAQPLDVNLPVKSEFRDKGPEPPTPRALLDTVLEVSDDDAPEDPDQPAGGGAVSLEQAAEVGVGFPGVEAASPPPALIVEFFERSVPMLGISFVASHSRLLLGRSRSRYFVCDPAANRWLDLPPSPTPPTWETASGLHYDVDEAAATGGFSFTVVLLARARRRRLRVETFSSATGRWDTAQVPGAQGAARRLGAFSPGIRVGNCFYWLSRRRADDVVGRGHIVRYDVARHRASVVRGPPEAEGSKGRAWQSLGSAGGRLRLCAFDVRDDQMNEPHDLEGVHGVWVMGTAAATWERVHEAVVCGREMPLDFAGACGGFIVVKRGNGLLRYDLQSGIKEQLAGFYGDDSRLGALYCRFDVFPLFSRFV